MTELNPSYTRFKGLLECCGNKQVVVYRGGAGTAANHDTAVLYTGNRDFIVETPLQSIDAADPAYAGSDYKDWVDNLKSSAEVEVQRDDAIAVVIGNFSAVPHKEDGKPVYLNKPNSTGLMTWFCGAADDLSPTPPASGRGEGQEIAIDFAAADASDTTKTIDLQFSEPVEMHDGLLWYTPVASWAKEDKFSFSAVMPATSTTAASGDGNANTVDLGGYSTIVPAAGDGFANVDLSQAVPVPAPEGQGYWNVDPKTGAVTPNPLGEGDWYLLSIPIESFFAKNMPMGHPLGQWDIDVYDSEWISERWILRLTATKATPADCSIAGWLMLFRENAT